MEIEPKLLDEICSLLTNCCAVRTSCEACGVSVSSFFRWLKLGDPDEAGHDPTYLEFWQRVTRARGRGKANLIELIQRHSKIDGRLALELLSRLSPNEYGKPYRTHDAEGDNDEPLPNFPPAQVTVVYQASESYPNGAPR